MVLLVLMALSGACLGAFTTPRLLAAPYAVAVAGGVRGLIGLAALPATAGQAPIWARFAADIAAGPMAGYPILIAACLGGAGTMRNVLTYCSLCTLGDAPRQAVSGVADDVLARLRRWGAVTEPTRHRGVFVVFDPEAAKRALDEVCAEAGV